MSRSPVLLATVTAVLCLAAAPEDPSHVRARSIIADALAAETTYRRLAPLTDMIGARLAGSPEEAAAVAWAKAEFTRDGVSVHTEPVMVPVWVRGEEHAEMVAPVKRALVMLGLGPSVGTPPDGITAPVVVVSSLEQLAQLDPARVAGKIVLYDNPFVRTGHEMHDYGVAVRCRTRGASDAARLGAVAVLVRSVATASLRTPHTGALRYADDAPKIPAAAITIEDARFIHRLADAGQEVVVRLVMGARHEPDREGANVVAEIKGRERPGEVVLIGAHLDSWDVGAGAIDDGAGCAIVIETMRLIAGGPPPRRTVRAVLYANEENGLRGGLAYRDAHAGELGRHVAAIEVDSGGARALGLSLKAGEGGVALLEAMMASVLAPLGAAGFTGDGGGADISPLEAHGVPQLGLRMDTRRYFDWHHTMADTLDKIEPEELQQATATMAAATWILAESERSLPRYVKPPGAADDE